MFDGREIDPTPSLVSTSGDEFSGWNGACGASDVEE
jgi:hypothetical protein